VIGQTIANYRVLSLGGKIDRDTNIGSTDEAVD
jgi:hypothetical protein